MRWLGSRISIGVCEVVSGWIHVEDRFLLRLVAEAWLASRVAVKRRTLESDQGIWRNYIGPRWRHRPSCVDHHGGGLDLDGRADGSRIGTSTVTRALATLRALLAFAVADERVTVNVAAMAKAPTGGQAGREGQMLSLSELAALATACNGPYGDLIMVLGLEGLRWSEVAGLQVGDRVSVPGPGLRLSRTVLASNGGGALYVDSLKSRRARTVP
jgi:integrase